MEKHIKTDNIETRLDFWILSLDLPFTNGTSMFWCVFKERERDIYIYLQFLSSEFLIVCRLILGQGSADAASMAAKPTDEVFLSCF